MPSSRGCPVLDGNQRTLHHLLAVAQEEVFDLAVGRSWGGTCGFAESRDSASKRRLSPSRRDQGITGGPRHGHHARAFPPGKATAFRDVARIVAGHISQGIMREHIRMQRLSRIGRNTLAVSVSTLLLSACNQGDDAPKPAAVAPQPAAPSMAALSIPLCLNGQCAVIDQDLAARAVRQRLRQYRRQRLPGHPDGGARGALEPDPGEGRQGVARRYRRSPVAAHPQPLWLRPRWQSTAWSTARARKSRRRVSTTSTPTVPTNSSSTDRWQARHPRCQGQAAHRGALRHHPGQRQRRRTRRLDQRRAWRGEVDHQPRYRRTEGRGLREPGRPPTTA